MVLLFRTVSAMKTSGLLQAKVMLLLQLKLSANFFLRSCKRPHTQRRNHTEASSHLRMTSE